MIPTCQPPLAQVLYFHVLLFHLPHANETEFEMVNNKKAPPILTDSPPILYAIYNVVSEH